jgi:hypothetical protein
MSQRCFCTPTSHEATRGQEISSLKCAKSDTFEILRCLESSNLWLVFRTSHNCQLTVNSIFRLLEQLPPGLCALQFHRHRKRIRDNLLDSMKTFAIDTNLGIRLHDFLKLNYVNQSNLINFLIEGLSVYWKSKRNSE